VNLATFPDYYVILLLVLSSNFAFHIYLKQVFIFKKYNYER